MGTYCALEFGAILILVLELRARRAEEPLSWRQLIAGPAGIICAVAGCAFYALATGTSPAELLDGLVLQHLRFDSEFFLRPPFKAAGLCLPFVAAAVVYYAAGASRDSLRWKLPIPPEAVVLGAVPFVFLAGKALFLHGAIGYCLPVVVAMARATAPREKSLGEASSRHFAVGLAALTMMYGYPAWGWTSQGRVSIFLLVPVWLALCADAVRYGRWAPSRASAQSGITAPSPPRNVERALPRASWADRLFVAAGRNAVLLILLAVALILAKGALATYRTAEPLELPGARLLRMPPQEAYFYRRLVAVIRAHGRTFFSMPGLCSLYFWTRENPPTLLNAGAWEILLTPRQQARLIKDLEGTPDLCVARWNNLTATWTGGRDMSGNKVVRYIADNFVTADSVGDCEILVRRASVHSVASRKKRSASGVQ